MVCNIINLVVSNFMGCFCVLIQYCSIFFIFRVDLIALVFYAKAFFYHFCGRFDIFNFRHVAHWNANWSHWKAIDNVIIIIATNVIRLKFEVENNFKNCQFAPIKRSIESRLPSSRPPNHHLWVWSVFDMLQDCKSSQLSSKCCSPVPYAPP